MDEHDGGGMVTVEVGGRTLKPRSPTGHGKGEARGGRETRSIDLDGPRPYPPMNVWIGEREARILAELPGVSIDDLEILLAGSVVTLKGSRREDDEAKYGPCVRKERRAGSFSRVVELPFLVNGDDVVAEFSKGILSLMLPRAITDMPKRIPIRQ